LIVDEVLAVGDAEFQKKCIGKMNSVASEGRTVLFVSHNMAAVQSLCTRGIMLKNGQVMLDADVETTLAQYLGDLPAPSLYQSLAEALRSGSQGAYFRDVRLIRDTESNTEEIPRIGDDILVEVTLHSEENINSVVVNMVIHDSKGGRIIDANNGMKGHHANFIAGQDYRATFSLKNVLLRPAIYRLELSMAIEHQYTIDLILEAMTFEIAPDLSRMDSFSRYPGSYRCEFDVSVSAESTMATKME